MDDTSSEGSADEEEVFKNFDEEAKIIIQTDTLPQKSADRYLLVYITYNNWKKQNKNLLSSSEENNLLVYFKFLKTKLKPPTLWSIWSMLRKTLDTRDNINISNFLSLKCFIKNNAKGYKPKKAFVLRWHNVMKFINEAPDNVYLSMKVILIFGICGCLRCDEITNMKFQDVEDLGNKYLVSIHNNKNDYAGQFIIGNLFYQKVKEYIALRPSDLSSDRFFLKYNEGKCIRQAIGVHKIGEVPSKIATYLQLPDPHRYTGHCFRRTSATLLSDSGASMVMIKQLGRWRSDLIAQGYVENSIHNRELIFNGVIQNANKTINFSKPSTSAQESLQNSNGSNTVLKLPTTGAQESMSNRKENNVSNENQSDLELNWLDFSEDFNYNNPNPIPSGILQNKTENFNVDINNMQTGFVTAAKKPIEMPALNGTKENITNNKLFWNKPRIKVDLNKNLSTNQAPAFKKRRVDEEEAIKDKNCNDIHSVLKENSLKFENCTFNSCIFKVTKCDCTKENDS